MNFSEKGVDDGNDVGVVTEKTGENVKGTTKTLSPFLHFYCSFSSWLDLSTSKFEAIKKIKPPQGTMILKFRTFSSKDKYVLSSLFDPLRMAEMIIRVGWKFEFMPKRKLNVNM